MNAPHPLHVLHPVERQQGRELPHESARLHVTGEAVYIDDIPELRGTLYAALILSPVAHGELLGEGIDREAILREHGVVAVFTAADIPREMLYAREAARKARVAVQELPAILSIDEAMAHQSFVMPAKLITRGKPAEAIAAAPHRVKGRTTCGQQEQFYLEGQIAYAVPREDGQLTIYVSTQHPAFSKDSSWATLRS